MVLALTQKISEYLGIKAGTFYLIATSDRAGALTAGWACYLSKIFADDNTSLLDPR